MQICGFIDRLVTKHKVLVLTTLEVAYDETDSTYTDLIKYYGGVLDIVDKLGGFVSLLPPTEEEYGVFLGVCLNTLGISLGDDFEVYESLGEIFLRERLTYRYDLLIEFLESCCKKYGTKKLNEKILLDEFYLRTMIREVICGTRNVWMKLIRFYTKSLNILRELLLPTKQ